MAIERKLIKESIDKVRVKKFVLNSLDNVGVGNVDVKRTPLGTRIIVTAVKPGLVIGRKGKNIQMLTSELSKKFNIENPQIEVQEVNVPEFNPSIMVEQLVSTIERGIHFRRASNGLIKRVMGKGALGILIEISGKLSGERSRKEKFMAGYIKYSVETSVKQAKRKAGVVGVKIRIAPPADPVKLAALVLDDSQIISESVDLDGKGSNEELQKLQESIGVSSDESEKTEKKSESKAPEKKEAKAPKAKPEATKTEKKTPTKKTKAKRSSKKSEEKKEAKK
jgi:small subunit ribosomal protein S3